MSDIMGLFVYARLGEVMEIMCSKATVVLAQANKWPKMTRYRFYAVLIVKIILINGLNQSIRMQFTMRTRSAIPGFPNRGTIPH